MQSLAYVWLAYASGLVIIGAFTIQVIWQRKKLRALIASLGKPYDSTK